MASPMSSGVASPDPKIDVTIAVGIGRGIGATPVVIPTIITIDMATVAPTPQPNPRHQREVELLGTADSEEVEWACEASGEGVDMAWKSDFQEVSERSRGERENRF